MLISLPFIKSVLAFRMSGNSSPRSPVLAAFMLAGAIPTIFSPDPRNTVMMEGRGRISVTTTRFTSLGISTWLPAWSVIITVPPDWDASGSPAESSRLFVSSFGSFSACCRPVSAARLDAAGVSDAPAWQPVNPAAPRHTLKMIAVNFFIILFLSLQPFIFTLCVSPVFIPVYP